MLHFHFQLIEPDGRIYRIRLSDGLHRQAHVHARGLIRTSESK